MSDFKHAWISHTTTLTPPSYEVGGIAKRIKTARLRRKTNIFGRDDTSRPPIIVVLYWISIIWSGCEVSRPYHAKSFGRLIQLFKKSFYHQGFFRRETASGFYPWGKVEGPRKRVAEVLCGWRHGNSFPMTQSAQSHRQMRSIPRCSKAVFNVFVFDSIHDLATMHNLSPEIFH